MSEDDPYHERGLAAPAPDYEDAKGVLLSLSEDEYSRAHALRPDWFDEDEEGMALYAARVEFIYELIVTFRWDRLRSRQALASLWGARVSQVDSMHRECKRRLAANIPDKAALQNLCIEQIQFVTQAAMNGKKGVVVSDGEAGSHVEYVDAPDYKAAITGIDKLAEYIDLKGPRKMTPKKTQLEETSLEDLLELMGKRMKEMKEPKNDERRQGILTQPVTIPSAEPAEGDPLYDSSIEE